MRPPPLCQHYLKSEAAWFSHFFIIRGKLIKGKSNNSKGNTINELKVCRGNWQGRKSSKAEANEHSLAQHVGVWVCVPGRGKLGQQQ